MNSKELCTFRNNHNKSAIVFIHGFLGDPYKTWGEFPNLINNDLSLKKFDIYSFRYSTCFLPDIRGVWSSDSSLDDLAIMFKTEIECTPFKNYKELNLIAHSMGGLIIQRAIINSNFLKDKLKNYIMFGTPSNGLKKSIPINWFKKQLNDICENSTFVKKLREDWDDKINGNSGFNLCVCAGERDEFVPSTSSLGPFDEEVRYIVHGDHLEIVKPTSMNSLSYRLVCDKILGCVATEYPYNLGKVLAELSQFELTVKMFQGKEKDLDDNALVAYALALEGLGKRDEAIRILNDNHKFRTDPLGTLGGRFKRLWLNEGIEEFGKKAYDLYSTGFDLASYKNDQQQMFYHKINQSFLELIFLNDTNKAQCSAREAIFFCPKVDPGMWEWATLGEAYLHLHPDKSIVFYKKAIQKGVHIWQIKSMLRQAEIICEKKGLKNISEELYILFTGASIN